MKLHVDQRFARVTIERFIEQYFSEEFNNAVAAVSGLKTRALVDEKREPSGKRERRVRMEPDTKLPGPIQKLVDNIAKGGKISYDEVSTYDPATQTVKFFIDSKLRDKAGMEGTIRFVSEGDGVRRTIDADIYVKAPLVGGMVEKFIEAETQKGYAKIGQFLQRWLDEHP